MTDSPTFPTAASAPADIFQYDSEERALAMELLVRNPRLWYVCTDPASKQPVKGIPFKDAPTPLDYCKQHVANGWPLAVVPGKSFTKRLRDPDYDGQRAVYAVLDFDDPDPDTQAEFLAKMSNVLQRSPGSFDCAATVVSRSGRNTHTWVRVSMASAVDVWSMGSRLHFGGRAVGEKKTSTVCTLWRSDPGR